MINSMNNWKISIKTEYNNIIYYTNLFVNVICMNIVLHVCTAFKHLIKIVNSTRKLIFSYNIKLVIHTHTPEQCIYTLMLKDMKSLADSYLCSQKFCFYIHKRGSYLCDNDSDNFLFESSCLEQLLSISFYTGYLRSSIQIHACSQSLSCY